jgi:DNA-binding Lrp family transcriptional regulator
MRRDAGARFRNGRRVRADRRRNLFGSPPASLGVDPLDVAMLRELCRDRVMWWGSTDPRLSIGRMARRLRVPPSTVRDRLRAWARSGFLAGSEVLPSPSLFRVGLAGTSVRVDDPRAKPDVIRDMGLVEGVLTTLDMVGPWMAVVLVDDGAVGLERRRRLLARLRGVDEVAPCVPAKTPPCTAEPAALDWRILAALRGSGRASLSGAAQAAKVSAKTFAKRYEALIAARAVWVIPLLDFTKLEGSACVRFVVEFDGGTDAARVRDGVDARVPDALGVLTPGEHMLGVPRDWLEVLVHVPAAAQMEDVERRLRDVPHVTDVAPFLMRKWIVYPAWFDARVRERHA